MSVHDGTGEVAVEASAFHLAVDLSKIVSAEHRPAGMPSTAAHQERRGLE